MHLCATKQMPLCNNKIRVVIGIENGEEREYFFDTVL